MKRIQSLAVVSLLIALLAPEVVAAEQPEKPPKGMGKYIVVLWEPGTPVPGKKDERMKRVAEPDFAKMGGRLLHSNVNQRVVFLPYAAVKELRRHETVSYVQRVWMGEPFSEWNETESLSNIRDGKIGTDQVATDAEDEFTWEKTYSYDGDGNVTDIGSDQFAYDDLGRLTNATINGSAESYTYDAFGNLIEIAKPGSSLAIPADPASNRLSGTTYDAAGNATTRKDRGEYVYDSLNMITEYATPNVTRRRILYDANDERIGALLTSGTHRWTIRDFDGQILREFKGGPTIDLPWTWEQDHIRGEGQLVAGETITYTYNGQSDVYMYGGERHYHLDHLGSVRVVTNHEGKALSENDFYPFGTARTKQHQESINWGDPHTDGMRFAGHWRDFMGQAGVESDDYLDYMHARYYDPQLGRFLSVDPVMGTPARPQSWNRYSYVQNNPINAIDPSGMKMECVTKEDGTEECTVIPDDTSPPAPPLPEPPPSLFADLGIFPDADRWLTDNVMRPIDHGYARFGSLPSGVSAEECHAAGLCQTLSEALDTMGPMVGGQGRMTGKLASQIGKAAVKNGGRAGSMGLRRLAQSLGFIIKEGGGHLRVETVGGQLVTVIPHTLHGTGTGMQIVKDLIRAAGL